MQIMTIGQGIAAYAGGIRTWLPRLAAALLATGALMALAVPAHAITPLTPASDSFTIQPGQTVHRDLNCASGAKAVGGGALTSTPYTRVWRSWPDSSIQNVWHFSVTSFNNVAETVWIGATCASGFVSFANYAGSTGNFAPNTFATGTATCDSARTSMGGGFIAPNASFVIVSSHVQGIGWRVRAFNEI